MWHFTNEDKINNFNGNEEKNVSILLKLRLSLQEKKYYEEIVETLQLEHNLVLEEELN
jgi:hypothetical protein